MSLLPPSLRRAAARWLALALICASAAPVQAIEHLWGDRVDEGAAVTSPAEGLDMTKGAPNALRAAAPESVNWLAFRCTFAGSPPFPLTTQQTRRLFEKPEVGVLDFFNRQAQGRTVMSLGGVVEVNLPLTHGAYWAGVSSTSAFLRRVTDDCLDGAAAQRALDDVTGLLVFLNDNIDCCAYGAPFAWAHPEGEQRVVPAVWLPPVAHTQPLTIAHEMVHGFNIGHSNNTDRDFDTTDNHWDLMSNIKLNRQVDEEIGPLPRGMHAFHRQQLGWLEPGDVTDASVGEGDDRTVQAVLHSSSLLRLHFTPTTGLVVSFRGAGHPDDGQRTEPAVFIDELDTTRVQPLWVVDAGLPLPTVAGTDTSFFTAGETWAVEEATPGRAVLIEVVSVAADEASVRVHLGPPPPPVNLFRDQFEPTHLPEFPHAP